MKKLLIALLLISSVSYGQVTNLTTNNFPTLGMPFVRPNISDTARKHDTLMKDWVNTNYYLKNNPDSFIKMVDIPEAGMGIVMNGHKYLIDTMEVMTVPKATQAISSMTAQIDTKLEKDTFYTFRMGYNTSLLAANLKMMYVDSVLVSINGIDVTQTNKIKSDSTFLKGLIDGKISAESDPIWLSEKGNYYTKTQGDARYLQTAPVTSVNSRTGAITLNNTDINSALGYTPYNSTNPNGYITSSSLSSKLNISDTTGKWLNSNYTPSYASLSGKPSFDTVKVYSKSGLLSNQGVIVTDTFSVSSATPTITCNLPASTTQMKILAVTGYRTGGTASNSPQVAVSGFTSTTVSLLITQQNTATVSILSTNVLSGLPFILVPDPTNVKVILSYIAY